MPVISDLRGPAQSCKPARALCPGRPKLKARPWPQAAVERLMVLELEALSRGLSHRSCG